MTPRIDIDTETFEFLKENAEPLVDSPSTVLRRLLGLNQDVAIEAQPEMSETDHVNTTRARPKRRRTHKRRRSARAPSGSLLPESEYELPILKVLERQGGKAASREVVAEVGEMIKDRLTSIDLQSLDSGGPRWENRVHFTRLHLIEEGFLKEGSPRGVWELTDAGQARVKNAND
jgi:hypothetical protein